MPVLNNVYNSLYFSVSSPQVHSRMFSRITLCAYFFVAIVFLFNWFVKYWDYWYNVLGEVNALFSKYSWYNPVVTLNLFLIGLVVLYVLVNLLLIFIKPLYVEIHAGKPPIGSLTIAYRFTSLDNKSSKILKSTRQLFPEKRLIQLYYTDYKAETMGLAYGAILNDDGTSPDDDTRLFLHKNDFRIFYTPSVGHAVYTVCPLVSWLVPTYWIAIMMIYPKIYNYCEKRNLSAYPVIEILEKDTLTFIAPLCQQNGFVVLEAEEMIQDLNSDASESDSTNCSVSQTSKFPINRTNISRRKTC